jgi:membrane-associated phospholipid phosphatase
LTYNWNNVQSTALSGAQEASIKATAQASFPTVGQRTAEMADLVQLNGSLTDTQKVIAEFWAGGLTTVSPPGMCICIWKLFVELQQTAHTRGWDAFFYSGLELSIHLFEAGRLVWGLKKANMQARPIQEIRRDYRGQTLQSWDGSTIAGEAWVPYQASNFVTPPFADFPSGHSAYSRSFANVMTRWFGASIPSLPIRSQSDLYLLSPLFTGSTEELRFGSWTVPQGTSEVQPGVVPAADITLTWTSWQDLAESAGVSRQYGGIHCASAHTGGVALANALSTELVPAWNITVPA